MVLDASRSPIVVVATTTGGVGAEDGDRGTSPGAAPPPLTTRGGFGGAAWLHGVPIGEHPRDQTTDPTLLFTQWASRLDAEAYLHPTSTTTATATTAVTAGGVTRRTNGALYLLDAVIAADQGKRAVLEDTRPDPTIFTAVIVVDTVSGQQAAVNDYNQHQTRDYIEHLPGFVSASFLVSEHDDTLIEVVQWRCEDDFSAAYGDQRFRDHIEVTNQYSTSEAFRCNVFRTCEPHPTATVTAPDLPGVADQDCPPPTDAGHIRSAERPR